MVSPRRTLILLSIMLAFSSCAPKKPPVSMDEELRRSNQVTELISASVKFLRNENPTSYNRAEAALELAREMKPHDPRVLDGLGCVAWRRKEFELAEHFFKRALEEDANYDRAYIHLALLAEHNNQPDVALQLLLKAIALNPDSYRARNNMAGIIIDRRIKLGRTLFEMLARSCIKR